MNLIQNGAARRPAPLCTGSTDERMKYLTAAAAVVFYVAESAGHGGLFANWPPQ